MKRFFHCSMPFTNRAGRFGIELDVMIENPDDCQDLCGRLAEQTSFAKVYGALPRMRIQVDGDKAKVWKRKKGTMIPQEANDQRMLHAFNSYMGDPCAAPTHANSFDDGIWEGPEEMDIDNLINILSRVFMLKFEFDGTFLCLSGNESKFRQMLSAQAA